MNLIESAQRYYVRFGDIPEGERSKIFAAPNWVARQLHHSLEQEHGVSVFWAHYQAETEQWVLDDVGNYSTALELIAQASDSRISRPIYVVTGDELDEQGIDGEPLLHNVKIVEKIDVESILIPGAHDSKEFARHVFFRGDATIIYAPENGQESEIKTIAGDIIDDVSLDSLIGPFASINGIEGHYMGRPAIFFRGLDSSQPVNHKAGQLYAEITGNDMDGRELCGTSMFITNYQRYLDIL